GIDPRAAATAQQLQVVAHETFVLLALPDEPPALWRGLEPPRDVDQLVERLRRPQSCRLEEIAPVIENADVRPDGNPVEPAREAPGLEGGGKKRLELRAREPILERQEPPR